MAEAQQREPVSGRDMRRLFIEDDDDDMSSQAESNGQIEGAEDGPLQREIAAFIPAQQHYCKTFLKQDLPNQTENVFRMLLELWNEFLEGRQQGVCGSPGHCMNDWKFIGASVFAGGQDMGAIVSRDIHNDIQDFISSVLNIRSDEGPWIRRWLARWNGFLLARQGESPVSTWSVLLSALGVLLYAVDMASDLGTAVYFACTGHWWRCALTLCVVYVAVAISNARLLVVDYELCSGPLDKLRYLVSLLVSWPDLQQCWALLRAEWELARSPRSSAHLVPAWQHSRLRVAELKLTEGMWEACPQALLQLVLLLPELQGDITGSGSMRIVSTAISLCAAGAALVNMEKVDRFAGQTVLPPGELAVLLVWAVPVTVSRLLCLALLLSVHLFWGLVCMTLHVTLFWAYRVYIWGVPGTRNDCFGTCLTSVIFLVSPFDNSTRWSSRAVPHTIHFLGNAGMTVVWALTTSMQCTQPALYAALIATITGMFGTGVLGELLYRIRYKRIDI